MDVTVSEVGPRDGLQSIKRTLPTADKLRWIAALAQAGLREIEVGSFVSPKVLPQMADCAEVVAQARTLPNLRVVALVPNLRYATMAFEAGTHVITIPVSVSEPHSIANIRKNHPEIIAEVGAIVALRNERFPDIRSRPRSRPPSAAPSRASCPRTTCCAWRRRWSKPAPTPSTSPTPSATPIPRR